MTRVSRCAAIPGLIIGFLAVLPPVHGLEMKDGLTQQQHGLYASAAQTYSQVLAADPRNLQALKNRGYCREALGLIEEAVADYSSALRVQPDDPQILFSRGLCLMDLEHYGRALRDLRQSLMIELDAPQVLLAHAVCRSHLAEGEDWESDVSRALEIDPECGINLIRRNVLRTEGLRGVDLNEFLAEFTGENDLAVRMRRFAMQRFAAVQSAGYFDIRGRLVFTEEDHELFDQLHREQLELEQELMEEVRSNPDAAVPPIETRAAGQDQEDLRGTWVIAHLNWSGRHSEATPERCPYAVWSDEEFRIPLGDGEAVNFSYTMEREPTDNDADRFWGMLDVKLEGTVDSFGWFLHQPAVESDVELLAIRLPPPTVERPGRFDDVENSLFELVMFRNDAVRRVDRVLETVRRRAEEIGAETDLALLQGQWRLLRANGESLREPVEYEVRRHKLLRKIHFGDAPPGAPDSAVVEIRLVVREDKKPKQMDWDHAVFGSRLAIYRLEADRLTVCLGRTGGGRPTAFAANAEAGWELLEFERAE